MPTPDYEKLGVFYLGRAFDMEKRKPVDPLLLYESKDLTTHAVCVGMTGSGKTGLCLSILEEAAIDGIPAIAIDPKGDIANLALTFPNLAPGDFRPWIDEEEARRRGVSPDDLAAETATKWKNGLASWDQPPERIARFKDACELTVYTPGSRAGRPLALLRSFTAPPQAIRDDAEALRDRVQGAVSGLLALCGIEADPMQSREHILLSRLLGDAWVEGNDMDLGGLIQGLTKPPFDKVGVFDVESFYPAKDRTALAMQLNNLLAAPGASAWTEGDPLDIGALLHTAEGKPRISILSIAHLSDAQRMFFVTTLLNEVVAWMRAQPGTSSLRAILYMDEIAGYFPPTAMPPSKPPMLTLLKQARAFGVGCVLATQNPVDLDYKGLANAGTWFVGRLQTERDKARLLDGLEGAAASAGNTLDRAALDRTLSGLGDRVFLMNNVHNDAPTTFQTRWTLSYLRGPITRDQLKKLPQSASPSTSSAAPAATAGGGTSGGGAPVRAGRAAAAASAPAARPVLPAGLAEKFQAADAGEGEIAYSPALLGTAKVHYVQAKAAVDTWRDVVLLAPLDDTDIAWEQATVLDDTDSLGDTPAAGARFGELPASIASAAKLAAAKKALAAHIYQARPLTLYRAPELKLVAQAHETLSAFKARCALAARESRDGDVEALKKKYAPKLSALQEKLRHAQARKAQQEAQAQEQTLNTALSVGAGLLGALFGNKALSVSNINRVGRAAKSAGKLMKERGDVGLAGEDEAAISQQLTDLSAQFDAEAAELTGVDPASVQVEELPIPPRKADIAVGEVQLVWVPSR